MEYCLETGSPHPGSVYGRYKNSPSLFPAYTDSQESPISLEAIVATLHIDIPG
jgi:hypothetical protein